MGCGAGLWMDRKACEDLECVECPIGDGTVGGQKSVRGFGTRGVPVTNASGCAAREGGKPPQKSEQIRSLKKCDRIPQIWHWKSIKKCGNGRIMTQISVICQPASTRLDFEPCGEIPRPFITNPEAGAV